jgi:vacuolar-type H+-ATPase subunit F/Vma7
MSVTQSSTEHKIAVIGPHDTVSGLVSLGVEAWTATTPDEVLEQLQQIRAITLDESKPLVYAVVCIIESLLEEINQDEYERLTAGALPAVVLLPGPQGSRGHAEARLRRLSEQAVGSAII